jgi:hypothetical protein
MTETIDSLMGFDPQNLEVFQEKPKQSQNANVYRTNPKLSKSEDGHYRSKIRVIYNPYNVKNSIVPQATYAMTDTDGFFMVKSMLGNGDRNCPIFKSWKKLWFSGDDQKKEWARKMYEKNESQWVLVQILEDDNQPELVGQVKVMKLPKSIYTKMEAKMNPSKESKKSPVPVLDWLIGLPLEMDVTPGPDDPKNPERKQREISYDLCEFDTDYTPIIRVDGTPLFSDEELEVIDAYVTARAAVTKAKSETARAKAEAEVAAKRELVKPLYTKAWDYLKESEVIDLEKECAYQPWTPELTARVDNWIAAVVNMVDPKSEMVTEAQTTTAVESETAPVTEAGDDFPF